MMEFQALRNNSKEEFALAESNFIEQSKGLVNKIKENMLNSV